MLIGVGLGPGDPELLTLRAVEVLKNSDMVYVPGRMAADLVAPYADAEVLDFPMLRNYDVLNAIWKNNAEIVAQHARDGTVAFGLIGDPNFFSTVSHLMKVMNKHYPDVETSTIPGISSSRSRQCLQNTPDHLDITAWPPVDSCIASTHQRRSGPPLLSF